MKQQSKQLSLTPSVFAQNSQTNPTAQENQPPVAPPSPPIDEEELRRRQGN